MKSVIPMLDSDLGAIPNKMMRAYAALSPLLTGLVPGLLSAIPRANRLGTLDKSAATNDAALSFVFSHWDGRPHLRRPSSSFIKVPHYLPPLAEMVSRYFHEGP